LDEQPARVGRVGAARVPADRPHAARISRRLHGQTDPLPFLRLAHSLRAEPAIAVARYLESTGDRIEAKPGRERGRLRAGLQRAGGAVTLEDSSDPPVACPGTVVKM